ncbi:MAG: SulP family inorganic anion transporter [Euryarchaeota archaeon]|nr:SulP family inorganic anion transporter [Euryarchaeota archaeon]
MCAFSYRPPRLATLKLYVPAFRPALLRSLDAYDRRRLTGDLTAGLIVGIVAIPLAIAFAIASGVGPAAGLVTAVVAGLAVALFGGSRVQIAGPTGAFVVIVYGVVAQYGVDGLLVATLMAGVILFLFGLFRMGQVIKFIPHPVITGFTAGIGAIIFLGQAKEIMGLRGVEIPAETVPRVLALAANAAASDPWAVGFAVGTILVILAAKRFTPRIPGPAIALVVFTGAAYYFQLPLETVEARFGELSAGLPFPTLPVITLERLAQLVPAALTIALLGAIESLLSAVVADGMMEDRHDSDQELIGQGIANLLSPLFGGIPATGAIARTATNVQNGATTPVSGAVHSVFILIFATFFSVLIGTIPMAVLAGILTVVAYNMSEIPKFRRVLYMPRSDAGVMLATFFITVFVDLVTAVEVGMVLASFQFMIKMSRVSRVEIVNPGDDPVYNRQQSLEGKEIPPGVAVYSIDGPFFFGAAEEFQLAIERVSGRPKVVIFRMRHVPYMDATGLTTLERIVKNMKRAGTAVVLSGVQNQPMDMMLRGGFFRTLEDRNVHAHIDAALERANEIIASHGAPPGARA